MLMQNLDEINSSSNNQSFQYHAGNWRNHDLTEWTQDEHYPHLTKLDFSGNKLESLHQISSLFYLTHLNVSHNRLQAMQGLENCTRLTYLDCSHNRLTQLPDLRKLRYLEWLNLKDNPLESIDKLWGCGNLRFLDLSDCQLNIQSIFGLNTDQVDYSASELLDIFENKLIPIDRFVLNYIKPPLIGLATLRHLKISNNPLLNQAFQIVLSKPLYSRIMHLWHQSENETDHQSEELPLIESTKDMIEFNVMNDFVDYYGILPTYLEQLEANACDISYLDGLFQMKRLQCLTIRDNQVTDMHSLRSLKELKLLKLLDLRNNPICDQNNYPIKIISNLMQLKTLDDKTISVKDKTKTKEYFNPSLEQLVRQDHRINLLHQFTKPQRLRGCTLQSIKTSYPILALIGPAGINKHKLGKMLINKLGNYFAPLLCHTDRPPRMYKSRRITQRQNHQSGYSDGIDSLRITESPTQDLIETPRKDEQDGENYLFVDKETFDQKRTSGAFIQTAEIMGYRYGLAWETLENVALKGLAGLFVGEIEGMLGLRLAGLQPRCILCLPDCLETHEKRLRERLFHMDLNLAQTLSRSKSERCTQARDFWIKWCMDRTHSIYGNYHLNHPGCFDAVLVADDIKQTIGNLLLLVHDYLGLDPQEEGLSNEDSTLLQHKMSLNPNINGEVSEIGKLEVDLKT